MSDDDDDECVSCRVHRLAICRAHGRLDGLGVAPGSIGAPNSIERLNERLSMLTTVKIITAIAEG